ncbi:MAG: hypothetical protein ACYS99_16385 [Planctomycetota bacterium]
MTRRFLYLLPLAVLLLLGPGTGVALPVEPSDGELVEGDQDPLFGDPDAFEAAAGAEDELGIEVDEEGDVPDRIRRAGIVGIWQYVNRHGGWFAGKIFVRVRGGKLLAGRIKGIFVYKGGNRELAAVILDRNGKFKGVLKGLYGKRGFRARWWIADDDTKGKAKAKFVAPYGLSVFIGRAIVDDDVFEEETPEE